MRRATAHTEERVTKLDLIIGATGDPEKPVVITAVSERAKKILRKHGMLNGTDRVYPTGSPQEFFKLFPNTFRIAHESQLPEKKHLH